MREKVEDGQEELEYCPTQDMLADLMTKPIAAMQFDALRTQLDIQVAAESSESVVEDAPRPASDKQKVQSGD